MITDINSLHSRIDAIIDYNWSKELQDFQKNPSPEHIFVVLVELDNFSNGSEFTPDYYLKENHE